MFLVKGFYGLCDVRTYNVKKYGLMFDVAPGPDRVAVLASISSAALAEKVNCGGILLGHAGARGNLPRGEGSSFYSNGRWGELGS